MGLSRDAFWIQKDAPYRHPASWAVTMLVGGLLAVCFELWAIYVVHRWEYGTMPLIPVLQVGWSPLLQMTAVPPMTLLVCWYLVRRKPVDRQA